MAQQNKSKKRAASQQQHVEYVAAQKQKQGKVRKVFTIVICIVVSLGLMLPIAGIGAASCSTSVATQSDAAGSSGE